MPLASANVTNETAIVGSTAGAVLAPAGVYTHTIPLPNLAAMTTAAADLTTGWIPGHRGKILSIQFFTTTLGTGSGASMVLNLEIGTTDLTGGVLTLTLATTTPLGLRIAGTAITALNEFTATDAISLEVAASGTVFTAGAGYVVLKIQNLDG